MCWVHTVYLLNSFYNTSLLKSSFALSRTSGVNFSYKYSFPVKFPNFFYYSVRRLAFCPHLTKLENRKNSPGQKLQKFDLLQFNSFLVNLIISTFQRESKAHLTVLFLTRNCAYDRYNCVAKLQTFYRIRKYFGEKVALKKLNDIFCYFSVDNYTPQNTAKKIPRLQRYYH